MLSFSQHKTELNKLAFTDQVSFRNSQSLGWSIKCDYRSLFLSREVEMDITQQNCNSVHLGLKHNTSSKYWRDLLPFDILQCDLRWNLFQAAFLWLWLPYSRGDFQRKMDYLFLGLMWFMSFSRKILGFQHQVDSQHRNTSLSLCVHVGIAVQYSE